MIKIEMQLINKKKNRKKIKDDDDDLASGKRKFLEDDEEEVVKSNANPDEVKRDLLDFSNDIRNRLIMDDQLNDHLSKNEKKYFR